MRCSSVTGRGVREGKRQDLRLRVIRPLREGTVVLERIVDLPDNVLGFKASGELTGDDYRRVLVPAVEEALARQDKLRLLYVLGDEVTGFSAGASWQDTKLGLGHINKWEKVAVVSDKEWLRHSVSIFGYLIPGEIKAYPTAAEGDARAWITA
jgi:SpoIIAA-like